MDIRSRVRRRSSLEPGARRRCWPVFVEGLHQLFVQLDPVGCVRRLDYYLPCALDVISNAASLAIVAGAALLKAPQIAAVVKARSADGLSLISLELDVVVFVASIAHFRRACIPQTGRGDAAAATWIFRGDDKRAKACAREEMSTDSVGSGRLRRGCDVDIPWR